MVEAVKRGFPQREIADAAFRYQQEVESGMRKVVGVNAYTEGDDGHTPILRIDPGARGPSRSARAGSARRSATPSRVEAALEALERAARDPHTNLMPLLLDAARAQATEGEMVQTLQKVFGTYTETPAF